MGRKRRYLVDEDNEEMGDTRSNRALLALKKLTVSNIVTEGFEKHVYIALRGLWRPILGDMLPDQLFTMFLTAYICARFCSGRTGFQEPLAFIGGAMSLDRFQKIVHCVVPGRTQSDLGLTLRDVVVAVHTHPITKGCVDVGDLSPGDPFFALGQRWWNNACQRKLARKLKRDVLTTALFVLSTRSASALQYLLDHPGFLLENCVSFGILYDSICSQSSYFGCDERKRRNLFTTEQKVFSAEFVLQTLLRQCWYEPEFLDALIEADTLGAFAKALTAVKLFGGDLQFVHSLEFLLTWDSASRSHLFRYRLSKKNPRRSLAKFSRHGTNSAIFLRLVGCAVQRQKARPKTYAQIAETLRCNLPRQIQFPSRTLNFPVLEAVDASSNACQAVAVLQTYLTGKFAGKERLKVTVTS